MEVACCFLSRAFRKREIIWFREKDALCASTATIPTTLFSLAIRAPCNIRTVWCEVGQWGTASLSSYSSRWTDGRVASRRWYNGGGGGGTSFPENVRGCRRRRLFFVHESDRPPLLLLLHWGRRFCVPLEARLVRGGSSVPLSNAGYKSGGGIQVGHPVH